MPRRGFASLTAFSVDDRFPSTPTLAPRSWRGRGVAHSECNPCSLCERLGVLETCGGEQCSTSRILSFNRASSASNSSIVATGGVQCHVPERSWRQIFMRGPFLCGRRRIVRSGQRCGMSSRPNTWALGTTGRRGYALRCAENSWCRLVRGRNFGRSAYSPEFRGVDCVRGPTNPPESLSSHGSAAAGHS